MAQKHTIYAPENGALTFEQGGTSLKAQIAWGANFAPRYTAGFNTMQYKLDTEIMRQLQPYMPLAYGAPAAMRAATIPGSGEIVVNSPYARLLYYTSTAEGGQGSSLRGPRYFEHMKADKKQYLRNFAGNAIGGT